MKQELEEQEEYDEEDDCYDDEDDDEEDEEFGQLQIGLIEETPPVVEGGGPSSGEHHTNGNGMAIGEVNLTSGNNMDDEDDESNINSDEQNEYLELPQRDNF